MLNASSDVRTIVHPFDDVTPGAEGEGDADRTRLRTRPVFGRQLGSYRTCVEIGRGGMATVYLARRQAHAGVSQCVALKCIRDAYASDPAFVDMFKHEARIASQLSHPNVCRVLDFSTIDGMHVMALEYLAGETLTKIRSRVSDPDYYFDPSWHACLMARIVSDAAEGLHAAHELRGRDGELLGVVHRDVSPGNVMVTYDGGVKVMDFGLVRSAIQYHATQAGTVKGKFPYVQPEVLGGKTADRRADVWSLGVVLWELLTGQRLFAKKSDAQTLDAVLNMEIPPPSEVFPGLPASIDPIVMRALRRDPAARYATARELGCELVKFIAEQGHPLGLADVAMFVNTLFPSGRACSRQLLEVIERIEESAAIEVDERPATVPFLESSSDVSTSHLVRRWSGRPLRSVLGFAAAGMVGALLALGVSGRPVGTPLQAAPSADPRGETAMAAEPRRARTARISPSAPAVEPPTPAEHDELIVIDDDGGEDAPEASPTVAAIELDKAPYVIEVEEAADPKRVVLRVSSADRANPDQGARP